MNMNSLFKKTALALATATIFGAGPALAAEVDTKGGIKVKSDDGSFVGELKGRMHADAYFFSDDGDINNENGTDFRRLRLTAESTIDAVWKGKIEIDFRTNRGAGGDAANTVLRDAYFTRVGFGPGNLTVGQLKTPMGLEELTSSNYITFIERAMPVSAVAPAHRRGIDYSGSFSNFSYRVMGYNTANRADGAGNRSDGLGLGTRWTWTPIKDKTQVMHLGLSLAQEQNIDGLGDQSTRYEANLADPVVFADFDNAVGGSEDNDISRSGLEFAYTTGPLSVQAEYLKADVSSDAAGDPEWDGAYMQASYFLTGESRPYKGSNGTFERIKPNAKKGAWEVAARYSKLEGENGEPGYSAEIKNATLGLNYYFNPQVRFMLNYIKSEVDAGTLAAPIKGDPNAIAFRIQYDF